jgi:hypothetical protein
MPKDWPMSPVATMRAALAAIVIGIAAATRIDIAMKFGSVRYAHATASASSEMSERMPLQASATPSVARLK